MSEIPTRNHCHAQEPHAINRRQPSFLPGVGHDSGWHLWEALLGEKSRNQASVGDVVVDGSQDCDLDAVLLHDRPRHVDQTCVCDTSGVRLRVP